MSDTSTENNASKSKTPENGTSIDLGKVSVGTFANLGGQPVDYAKSAVLDRAGVPQGASLRKELVYTHASAQGKIVPRLPDVFPPAELPAGQKLESAQDYLDLIAATPAQYVPTAAEIAADQQGGNPKPVPAGPVA